MHIWQQILTPALYAPSPHNTQPWRIKLLDDAHALLFMDIARTLPDEDRTGHFLLCAMGIFLEAVNITAKNAGYTLEANLIPFDDTRPLIPFAKLRLHPGSSGISPYSNDLLRKRITSRLPSTGVPIPTSIADFLRAFAPDSAHHYHQIDDPQLMELVLQENIRAVFHDLNDKPYHDEIARWFRYSDREAQIRRDGLDYRCMRSSPLDLRMMQYFPQLMKWPVTRSLLRSRYRKQIGLTTHLGIIDGPFFDDHAAVDAGRFLLPFWLELARHGLSIHPFGNLVTNAQARARIRQQTGIHNIWLVFRIGYTAQPPRSYRRTLDEVLLRD